MTIVVGSLTVLVACGPKYPNCKKDGDCHDAEYCVNNLCQQCRDSGDCAEGQECRDGACREIPGYCKQSSDCAEGQVCRENRCGPCMEASDCKDGQVCMDGLCGVAECQKTEDCEAGLSCINYRCRPDPSATSGLGPGDCAVEPLYFEFDSSDISPDMRSVIEKNYDCFAKRGGRLTMEGHCDPRGTTEYNLALGDRRARMVSKVMVTLGADQGNLRIVSKGEEEATGRDESGWIKDRRVDFE